MRGGEKSVNYKKMNDCSFHRSMKRHSHTFHCSRWYFHSHTINYQMELFVEDKEKSHRINIVFKTTHPAGMSFW